MEATRRTALTASGIATLALAACTTDDPRTSSTSDGAAPSTATQTAAPQPDQLAVDRATELSGLLLAEVQGAAPGIDPGGRFAALHTAHLTTLARATAASDSAAPSPTAPAPPATRARLRRRELAAQRELAHLAAEAESGALARLLASMSAGIAAHLATSGRVGR